jgi:hypothetical protein
MLDRFVDDLIQGVNAALKAKSAQKIFHSGAAADHVVTTMARTLGKLDPERIIKVFDDNPGRPRMKAMWDELGDDTITCIANGAIDLAEYWESAWKEGRAASAAADFRTSLRRFPTQTSWHFIATRRSCNPG